MFNIKSSKGQIALPFVLLVGGIIVEIVIAGSIVSFFVNASSLGERLSIRALSIANTGVYDAVQKISTNKEFGAGGKTYTINIEGEEVTVTISRTVDNTNDVYNYTIESSATVRSRQRKMEAKLVVDQETGQVNLRSVEEVSVK